VSRDVTLGLAVAAWLLLAVVLGTAAASGDAALFVFLALTVPPLAGLYVFVRRRMLRAR
jgi:hypothetical protein